MATSTTPQPYAADPPENPPRAGALTASERAPRAPAESAIKRDLCLVGYAGLISGRAEDLRMSALALSRHSRQWVVLDRLSGAITTEDSRPAPAFAGPPGINLVHLNADTAFFDYLLLRERGIER